MARRFSQTSKSALLTVCALIFGLAHRSQALPPVIAEPPSKVEVYAVPALLSGGASSADRPVELGCTTQPISVFASDPVVANASTVNMSPRAHPIYTWTTTGGRLRPNDSSATIDTSGLAPGDYTIAAHLSYGRKSTNCTSPFTVKAFEPPTIRCIATPSAVTSGTTVNISTSGISPQNRPLTYSYAATAGRIVSSGPTATLSTTGLRVSTITVTCNLVDDYGKTATTSTQVNIRSQPLPTVAQPEQLCSISFARDKAHPTRVSDGARGCLDDIALTMNRQSDAQLFIIANSAPGEPPRTAAERALNLRQYLTQEKGVSAARIYLRTGHKSDRTARTVLVPAGAIFNDASTHTINERAIRRR
jgi:hypothetical protein